MSKQLRLYSFTSSILVVAAAFATLCGLSSFVNAAEKNVGQICFHNNYNNVKATIYLYHRESTGRKWKNTSWTFAPREVSHLSTNGRRIRVRGDWMIRVKFSNGAQTNKYRISQVGAHQDSGKWHVFASNVDKGTPPRVRLPIIANRGAASWEINHQGVVTSRIRYTVGSGSGSKKYATGLVVEFEDGNIYTASATKTVGRPLYGTRKGTATNQNHTALPVHLLKKIRRVYVKYEQNSNGPGTVSEWINKCRKILKEGDEIYTEIKDNDLVRDVVILLAG